MDLSIGQADQRWGVPGVGPAEPTGAFLVRRAEHAVDDRDEPGDTEGVHQVGEALDDGRGLASFQRVGP